MYDQASNSIQNVTKMGSNESVNITGKMKKTYEHISFLNESEIEGGFTG